MKEFREIPQAILPLREHASVRDKIAAGFARDLTKKEESEPARVIGEVAASRLAGMVDFEGEELDDFLISLPGINDLKVNITSEGPIGAIIKNFRVNLPGLLGYAPELRRKIMREYVRLYLLRQFSGSLSSASFAEVGKNDVFVLLNSFYSKKNVGGVDNQGNYTYKDDDYLALGQGVRRAVMEQDPELFIDLLVALAAARPEEKLTLRECWQRMFADTGPSIAIDREVGVVTHLTLEDGLPYREGKLDEDAKIASNRLALAAKQPEMIEELPPDAIEPIESNQAGDRVTMTGLLAELKAVAGMRESLRLSIKNSLAEVDIFLKEMGGNVGPVDGEFINALEDVLGRIRQSLQVVLEMNIDKKFVAEFSDQEVEGETMEELQGRLAKANRIWNELRGKVKAAVNIINGLSFKIAPVRKLTGRSASVALADLKIESESVLTHLRNMFSSIK